MAKKRGRIQNQAPPGHFTVRDVAQMLGITPTAVRMRISNGSLEALRETKKGSMERRYYIPKTVAEDAVREAREAEASAGEHKDGGLSLEKVAKMLDISEDKVKILAGQGRLRKADTQEDECYDFESVFFMQAENLIREMQEEAGDKHPKLREKIDTLALLQYQRGHFRGYQAGYQAGYRAGDQEFLAQLEKLEENVVNMNRQLLERIEKLEEISATIERRGAERLAQIEQMNEAAERRLEEMRAMKEGALHRLPRDQGTRKSS
jgi:flagellar biosynthesis/type III secretory pathway protein FliH